MSKEAFQIPTGGTAIPAPSSGAAGFENKPKSVTYICGDCNAKVQMDPHAPDLVIRCTECGYRVLYKMRTTRMVQFEAR